MDEDGCKIGQRGLIKILKAHNISIKTNSDQTFIYLIITLPLNVKANNISKMYILTVKLHYWKKILNVTKLRGIYVKNMV